MSDAKDRARRLFEQVKTGKIIFFNTGNGWDIIGPADQIEPGATVTVTKASGATTCVIVQKVMAERTVEGFATRTATFINAPTVTPSATAVPAPREHRVRDRQAARVGNALGLTSSAPAGSCHYCGLALNRRGECEECV